MCATTDDDDFTDLQAAMALGAAANVASDPNRSDEDKDLAAGLAANIADSLKRDGK